MLSLIIIGPVVLEEKVFKVIHSLNLLYQGFAEKYLLGISTYIAKLKTQKKMGVSVYLIEQWWYEVDNNNKCCSILC